MNDAALVGALVTPLAGALAALAVPTPGGRAARSERPERPQRPRRRLRRTKDLGDGTSGRDDGPPAAVEAGEGAGPGASLRPSGTSLVDGADDERAGNIARLVVRVAALASAGLWLAITLLGGASAGPVAAMGAASPAAAGAGLLLAAVSRPAQRLTAATSAVALALANLGLALAIGQERPALAVTGLAAAAILIVLADRGAGEGAGGVNALALAGAAALAAGLARAISASGSPDLAPARELGVDAGVLLVGGAAMVAVAGALSPRQPGVLLVPIALAIGVPAAAALGSAGEAIGVVAALVGALAAAVWALRPAGDGGGMRWLVAALVLAALAAAAPPGGSLAGTAMATGGAVHAGVPAAWLLAGAAVITAVTLVPFAAVTALPGLAALAVVVVADPSPARLLIGVLAAAGAMAGAEAVRRRARATEGLGDLDGQAGGQFPPGPLVAGLPALALGAWLLVAPGSWAWVGEANLDEWPESVAVALAAGLIAVVAAGATRRVGVPALPRLASPDPAVAVSNGDTRWLTVAAGVVLGLALLALLASSTRSV